MTDAYILDAVRTPFGKRKGALSQWRPDDLLAWNIGELLKRSEVDRAQIEDLVVGCVTQIGHQGTNVARLAGLIAELPVDTGGVTLNRMCGSGQQAANFAAMAVMADQMDLVMAAGVEHMTSVAIGSDSDWGDFSPELTKRWDVLHQGESAERIADRWDITREELDAFSLASHERAIAAQDAGFFKSEVAPVPTVPWDDASDRLDRDELPRRGSSLEKLAALSPVFREDGRITAGSSSGINDGAGAMLIGSRAKANELGVTPRARIVRTAVAGVDPEIMLTGPIPATRKVLDKAGLSVSDIDTFEVNEAFASVPLAWLREIKAPEEKLNPNGGAIAIGHPLGASGVRLLTTAVNQLEATGGTYALIAMCIGFGQATATILERV